MKFRMLRWPACPTCLNPMSQECDEPKHVELEPKSKAPFYWLYLLRCTKCARLANYAENSTTGLPHTGAFACRAFGESYHKLSTQAHMEKLSSTTKEKT